MNIEDLAEEDLNRELSVGQVPVTCPFHASFENW